VSLDQVRDRTGFPLLVRDPLEQTTPPTDAELHILRDEVDPHRYLLGR
jgi:glutaconate CoA-transferase subunit B